MENYICINGKKAPLTEEQLHALGLKSELISSWQVSEHSYNNVKRYAYKCPNCETSIYSTVNFSDSMLRAHRFCGYCGVQNVFGGI